MQRDMVPMTEGVQRLPAHTKTQMMTGVRTTQRSSHAHRMHAGMQTRAWKFYAFTGYPPPANTHPLACNQPGNQLAEAPTGSAEDENNCTFVLVVWGPLRTTVTICPTTEAAHPAHPRPVIAHAKHLTEAMGSLHQRADCTAVHTALKVRPQRRTRKTV